MAAATAEAVRRGEEVRARVVAEHTATVLVEESQWFPFALRCACGAHSGWATTRERAEYLHGIHVRVEAGHFAAVERERRL